MRSGPSADQSAAREGVAFSSEPCVVSNTSHRDPITVIKWKEIYENLEQAIDRCEDVANIVEGVVLEQT